MTTTEALAELIEQNPNQTYLVAREDWYNVYENTRKVRVEYRVTAFQDNDDQKIHNLSGTDLPKLIQGMKEVLDQKSQQIPSLRL